MEACLDLRHRLGDQKIFDYLHELAWWAGRHLSEKWCTRTIVPEHMVGAMVLLFSHSFSSLLFSILLFSLFNRLTSNFRLIASRKPTKSKISCCKNMISTSLFMSSKENPSLVCQPKSIWKKVTLSCLEKSSLMKKKDFLVCKRTERK